MCMVPSSSYCSSSSRPCFWILRIHYTAPCKVKWGISVTESSSMRLHQRLLYVVSTISHTHRFCFCLYRLLTSQHSRSLLRYNSLLSITVVTIHNHCLYTSSCRHHSHLTDMFISRWRNLVTRSLVILHHSSCCCCCGRWAFSGRTSNSCFISWVDFHYRITSTARKIDVDLFGWHTSVVAASWRRAIWWENTWLEMVIHNLFCCKLRWFLLQ